MSETITTVPLSLNNDGVLLVGDTRVSFDSVIAAFEEGSTPEEIVLQYSSLSLADAYAVISYYLQHPAEVADYLERRKKQRGEIKKDIESRFNPNGIRERLLARKQPRR